MSAWQGGRFPSDQSAQSIILKVKARNWLIIIHVRKRLGQCRNKSRAISEHEIIMPSVALAHCGVKEAILSSGEMGVISSACYMMTHEIWREKWEIFAGAKISTHIVAKAYRLCSRNHHQTKSAARAMNAAYELDRYFAYASRNISGGRYSEAESDAREAEREKRKRQKWALTVAAAKSRGLAAGMKVAPYQQRRINRACLRAACQRECGAAVAWLKSVA